MVVKVDGHVIETDALQADNCWSCDNGFIVYGESFYYSIFTCVCNFPGGIGEKKRGKGRRENKSDSNVGVKQRRLAAGRARKLWIDKRIMEVNVCGLPCWLGDTQGPTRLKALLLPSTGLYPNNNMALSLWEPASVLPIQNEKLSVWLS